MKKRDILKSNILKCITSYRNLCHIIDAYFHINDVTITRKSNYYPQGRVIFSLGPSFEYEDKWTLKKLEDVREEFYLSLQQILDKTDYDFITISTEYRSWAVSGYKITIGYNL